MNGTRHRWLLAAALAPACASEPAPAGTGTETSPGSTGGAATSSGSAVDSSGGAGGEGLACDPAARDCPEGHKCLPIWRIPNFVPECAPVPENPRSPGDTCELSQPLFPSEPVDPCDENSACASLGGDPNTGECLTLCPNGDGDCVLPGRRCLIGSDGGLRVCLPECDPLANECMEGGGCYTTTENLELFVCGPELPGAGGHGSQCEGIQPLCRSGHGCYPDGVAADGCEGAWCCAELCDLSADNTCPGAADGEACISFYPGSDNPPHLPNLGICAIPS